MNNNLYKIFFTIIFLSQNLSAQLNDTKFLPSGLSDDQTKVENDSTSTLSSDVKKNYWLPAVEVVGLNFAVWGYQRYLSRQNWAAISWESIKNNFKNGFVWDYDGYLINQFWHPYHGANYYNTARSNGLTFWESAPYAFFGSLTWEYFYENERPSYNDIVNTPVTGIILGEISFRVSNLIIDESAVGLERVIREFTSILIDPMQGLNRMIRGDMWKTGLPRKRDNFSVVVSTGVHNVFFGNKFNDNKSYLALRADLNYGDEFSVSQHQKPFDYFSLHIEINITQDDNIVVILASGVLWDNNIKLFNTSKNIIGVYKEVDIHINTVYKLSATSVTGQIINRIELSPSVAMQNYLGLSAILMGGTNSQYSSEYGKDYNIGPGASGKIGLALKVKNIGEVYTNYKRYWIHTLSGAESEEFVGLFNFGISYNLFAQTALGLDYLLYERYGDYKYFPNTSDANSALRIYIRYNI
ncbi:DUF3943 domain-containing protein [Melioribacter sp. OK-6-Me]|uniref:DUF3943 domain-containing protein n=1 Tax=unclassified Melioribacter TaxID=2627329 RepID=UPI003ED940FA